MSTLCITRDELVAVLESKLPRAEAYDARRMTEHRKAETESLAIFRAACRDAAKWDWATAKDAEFAVVKRAYKFAPACPDLMAAKIQRAIARLRVDRRKSMTLDSRGRDGDLFTLATWDPDLPPIEGC